jgi:nitroimidazol reductase NimA-like FMN-containing flavoprotein (pyridoxamine 5'-phosphate oxidase superfamily)
MDPVARGVKERLMDENSPDPAVHVAHIKQELDDIAQHARRYVGVVDDARAKALFETTAEVLSGLSTAYGHFEEGKEEAWRR